MKKIYPLQLSFLIIVIFSFCNQKTRAQSMQDSLISGSGAVSTKLTTHNELRFQTGLTKLKASIPEDNSQETVSFSIDYMRWYGSNKFSAKKYFFSYGIGIGIGEKGGMYPANSHYSATKSRFIYLQVPLIMRINDDLGSHGTLFIDGGAYYGFLAKAYFKGNTKTSAYVIGDNPQVDDWRRSDFGLRFDAGYQCRKLPFMAGFTTDIGLQNILPGGIEGYNGANPQQAEKITQHSIGLFIGYLF